jgi:hypothetical protein
MMLAGPLPHYPLFVILNSFQDNKPPLPVVLKQVQHDENIKS